MASMATEMKLAHLNFEFALVVLELGDGHIGLGLQSGVDHDKLCSIRTTSAVTTSPTLVSERCRGLFKQGLQRFRHVVVRGEPGLLAAVGPRVGLLNHAASALQCGERGLVAQEGPFGATPEGLAVLTTSSAHTSTDCSIVWDGVVPEGGHPARASKARRCGYPGHRAKSGRKRLWNVAEFP